MERKKLKLNKIAVESFITNLDAEQKRTIQGAEDAARSWLISDCLMSLRCSATIALEDLSGTWTKARVVGLCDTTNSRNILTQMNECPKCVRVNAPVPEN